jgi:hypothetical protein
LVSGLLRQARAVIRSWMLRWASIACVFWLDTRCRRKRRGLCVKQLGEDFVSCTLPAVNSVALMRP